MPAKILIVEDNLDMREVLHLYLKTEGFDVVTASDGREGLYMARAEKPDLILTDIHMPELDGVSMVRELRTEPEIKDTPIIAITAFGSQQQDEAIRAGADRAINKPTHFESLIDDINELLNKRKQE